MYFMKWHVPMSYANVGAHFGQNHATVIHAVREFENKMKLYPSDRQQFQEVCSLLGLRGSTELLISMQNEYKIKAWDDKNSFVVYRGTIIMRGSMQACREFVMRKLNIR